MLCQFLEVFSCMGVGCMGNLALVISDFISVAVENMLLVLLLLKLKGITCSNNHMEVAPKKEWAWWPSTVCCCCGPPCPWVLEEILFLWSILSLTVQSKKISILAVAVKSEKIFIESGDCNCIAGGCWINASNAALHCRGICECFGEVFWVWGGLGCYLETAAGVDVLFVGLKMA